MEEHIRPDPPWLPLLNSMQREWREAEILEGRDPDPEIERLLLDQGKWSFQRVR